MIEIDGIEVQLGGTAVLDGVDATIGEGQFVGLVGPNGAGKTTLLQTVSGVFDPDAGEVRVDGDPVSGLASKEASRRIAVVPQDTTLSFDFPVEDVVAMGRHPYQSRLSGASERDRERVAAAMARTEVEHLADRPITAVSGGERQRVLLARALAQDAPVLLLDEPTASLDINHQVRTLELVRELADEGRTVVAAIHDLNLAAHYCDDLLLLADGGIRASGDPETVLSEENLETAFDTRAAISRHPVTGATYVTALPERPAEPGDRVHVVGGGGTASRLLYLLWVAGYEVSVGVLGEGDVDLETARSLGLDAVTERAFTPVGDEARRAVEARIRAADATVLADAEVGTGNLATLRAVRKADSVVVVENSPSPERNDARSEAAAIYAELRERGRVVDSDELLSAVREAVETPDRSASAEAE